MRLQRLFNVLLRRLARVWHFSCGECEASIKLRQPLAPIALLALVGWGLVAPNSLALVGGVLLSSLLLCSFGWTRIMAARVTTGRALRYSAVQVGDELEENVSLENRSDLPVIWAEFSDRSTAPGYSIDGVRIAGRRAHEQWRMRTTCSQRGVYALGPWDVRLGDPFGLFEARQQYRQHTEIVVYPPLAALPPEIAQQRRRLGDKQPFRQPLAAETISATTTRPYVMGDSLHRVHWRTTARHDDLYVKVFEPEAASIVWLIPDLDAAIQLGEGNESTLEKMIVLVASIAARLLNQHLAVGVLLNAARTEAVYPQAGPAHLWTILRALALAQPLPDQPLAGTLVNARSIVSLRDSVVVLTPSLDPEWTRMMSQLTGGGRGGGAEVVLLDRASFGGEEGAALLADVLMEQGVMAHVVKRQDIRPATGTYGEVRRWEFMTLGTGRVVVKQTPREAPSSSLRKGERMG